MTANILVTDDAIFTNNMNDSNENTRALMKTYRSCCSATVELDIFKFL